MKDPGLRSDSKAEFVLVKLNFDDINLMLNRPLQHCYRKYQVNRKKWAGTENLLKLHS